MADGDQPTTHDVTLPAAPVTWPDGRQAAAFLGFDMDAEDVALTVDPESRHRLSAMSHQAYGPLTGMPRVLVKPVPAKTAAVAPSKPETAAVARPAAGLTRTVATIVAQRTAFGHLSDRDTAYMQFFASFAKRAPGGTVNVSDLHNCGKRVPGVASNKPSDAGVINRLRKAGLLHVAADGTTVSFTATGKTHAAYTKA